jgi:hypothetical protein
VDANRDPASGWLAGRVCVAAVYTRDTKELRQGEAGDKGAAADTGGKKNEAFGD